MTTFNEELASCILCIDELGNVFYLKNVAVCTHKNADNQIQALSMALDVHTRCTKAMKQTTPESFI